MTMSIILKWGKLLRIAIYETHTYGGERCSSQLKGGTVALMQIINIGTAQLSGSQQLKIQATGS